MEYNRDPLVAASIWHDCDVYVESSSAVHTDSTLNKKKKVIWHVEKANTSMYIRNRHHVNFTITYKTSKNLEKWIMRGFHRTGGAGDAYFCGHLVQSHSGLACILLDETNRFPERVVILTDYALRTSLATFLIFLETVSMIPASVSMIPAIRFTLSC